MTERFINTIAIPTADGCSYDLQRNMGCSADLCIGLETRDHQPKPNGLDRSQQVT